MTATPSFESLHPKTNRFVELGPLSRSVVNPILAEFYLRNRSPPWVYATRDAFEYPRSPTETLYREQAVSVTLAVPAPAATRAWPKAEHGAELARYLVCVCTGPVSSVNVKLAIGRSAVPLSDSRRETIITGLYGIFKEFDAGTTNVFASWSNKPARAFLNRHQQELGLEELQSHGIHRPNEYFWFSGR